MISYKLTGSAAQARCGVKALTFTKLFNMMEFLIEWCLEGCSLVVHILGEYSTGLLHRAQLLDVHTGTAKRSLLCGYLEPNPHM